MKKAEITIFLVPNFLKSGNTHINEKISQPYDDNLSFLDLDNDFEQFEKYFHQKPIDKIFGDILEDLGDPVAAYIPDNVGKLPIKQTVG